MKTQSITYCLLLVIMMTLISCDPGVSYDKIIQNDSDHDIMLYVYRSSPDIGHYYISDSMKIGKHSQISVYHEGGIGSVDEYEDCSIYADSIKTRITDNDTLGLTLNLNNPINWMYSVLDKNYKHGGTCECRAIINNEMIK